ncbi:MAG TPA: ornithine cyclodeaminase family protein [Fimbriimonadaceae bacterium]|nr:ornithine cyclodeaminase family protein [Fimbriimonadaceae bacterium]
MPLVLRRSEVSALLPMSEAIDLARSAFLALGCGQAELPPRVATQAPRNRGTHLSMPCAVQTDAVDVLSVKLVTVFKDNAQTAMPTTMGTLLLHDPRTGALLAIMDAEALTAIRTGAASALAADLLAPAEADTLGVIGAGGQAGAQIEGMLQIRPIRQILIHSRTPDRALKLAEEVQDKYGVSARSVEGAQEAVEYSRLIVCATNSQTPIVQGEWLWPGTHISAIGAFRADMAELDAGAVGRCRVFVDRLASALAGAGDLIQAEAAGKLDWNDVVELGDLVAGNVAFERRADDVTLFKSVGTAVQDAFVADHVYRKALSQGVGTMVEMD